MWQNTLREGRGFSRAASHVTIIRLQPLRQGVYPLPMEDQLVCGDSLEVEEGEMLQCCHCDGPIEDDLDETPSYCGQMHASCFIKHCRECEVCLDDAKN